jgi:enoyl-CoA hydratase/carnithine racemase
MARVDAGDEGSEIALHDAGRVRVVTLNRPGRLNAFTSASYLSLAHALDAADADPEVSVVLITGAGRGFSSGVDLESIGPEPDLAENFDLLVDALIGFSKPLVAAVHGVAIGFGATLLLHCDLVLVADTARLRMPFTVLGTTPEAGSSALLPMRVGAQRAADLLLTSRWFSGSEAAQMGLAARCHPEDELHSEAMALAQSLTELPDAALIAAKELMKAGVSDVARGALGRERAAVQLLGERIGPMRTTKGGD